MSKSKTFWALSALLSLGIMLFSGYSLYGRISVFFSGDTLEILSAQPPPLPQEEEDEEEPSKPGGKPAEREEAGAAGQESDRAVKTLFEYKNAKARSVQLSGSFTSWKDVKMTKKEGVWKAEVYILPGVYPYHFTADGVKKLDPQKPKAPTGDSLIVVTGGR